MRFRREAQLLASLNHPNVAAIYGFEESTPRAGEVVLALALDLVEGPTLADRLADGRLARGPAVVSKKIANDVWPISRMRASSSMKPRQNLRQLGTATAYPAAPRIQPCSPPGLWFS
jgi:serine/threonine protein kinase